MPLDHPSQAQTAGARFIQGLLGGVADERANQNKEAYLRALYAGKPKTDPMELERLKQEGRKELIGLKPAAKPRPAGGKAIAREANLTAVQQAVAEARRKAEAADPLKGEIYMTTLNNELRPRLEGIARENNRVTQLNLGRPLKPEEMADAAQLAALAGEIMPAQPGWKLPLTNLEFGAKPPVIGPVAPTATTAPGPGTQPKKRTLRDY
jgi:hypothetical protein